MSVPNWMRYREYLETPQAPGEDMVELVPMGELAALKERDEARAELADLRASLQDAVCEYWHMVPMTKYFELKGEVITLRTERDDAETKLQAALKELAKVPAAAPEPKTHDPFREFTTDRRRVGG